MSELVKRLREYIKDDYRILLPRIADLLRDAATSIDALEAENARLMLDAQRYRWIRKGTNYVRLEEDLYPMKGEDVLDEYVDDAMKGTP